MQRRGRGIMKKILIISQNYYPEQFRINDISFELVNRGYDVTVLTGLPNYPAGKIFEGYEKGQKRTETINGVKVIRCYERERKDGGAINLFLNYYSFVHSSKKMIKKLDKDFDVVIVNQLSPIMQCLAGIKYKKKYGAKLIIYSLDLWPASLSAGGISGGFIYNYYKRLSSKIYKSADVLMASSKEFSSYFESEFGINKKEVVYLPQYAEDIFKVKKHNYNKKITNLVFAGNVGKMQSVETLIEAGKLLEKKNVKIHIVGGGSNLEKCKELAKDCKNIIFYGQRPLEEMPKFYDMADAMIVSLKKDDLISKTLPGKVQTYMAAGKPIIASGDNEMKNIIKSAKCGYVSPAEDVQELYKNILKFMKNKEKQKLAKNARQYYEKNFTKEKFFETLIDYCD